MGRESAFSPLQSGLHKLAEYSYFRTQALWGVALVFSVPGSLFDASSYLSRRRHEGRSNLNRSVDGGTPDEANISLQCRCHFDRSIFIPVPGPAK